MHIHILQDILQAQEVRPEYLGTLTPYIPYKAKPTFLRAWLAIYHYISTKPPFCPWYV